MALLDMEYLEKLEAYFTSGDLKFDFENGDEDKKFAILEFLEKLMDVAELADEQATKLIFKDGYLEMLSGVKPQK
ncbi:hypothetical protein [Desulfobaculum bizertense]|uniref:Uncharacterized protein n=1 Tax=Desulfobaculum bizertense DSM 18034 TaxID=1121442 RepID=A0A1T4WHK1_9BACT|nr:hypothetical protein [Desulfobaculum bizertense]SKA76649.1 hypothetical protein SAMN02745702_02282 [Desulfobaculum bizertense DSM 18034]